MNLRKVIDLDERSLDQNVRKRIEELVARGYQRAVLVINDENLVYVDPELAREELSVVAVWKVREP